MSMSDWYGAQSAFAFTLASSVEAQGTDLSTLATAAGWDGTVPIVMTVNSGSYIRSTTSTQPALTIDVAESEVINNGAIFGHGGGTGGGAGGHAIKINALSTIVTNNTGAFIAGGGGGGGGSGGGGGAGQSPYNQASSNGPTVGYLSHPGFVRTNGTASGGSCAITALGGTGGDQGGGGVTPATTYISGGCSSPSYFHNPPGVYAGERQQNSSANVANNPALGGSVLSATSNTDGAGSNGGGGWGRSGENGGGAGGDAINASLSYTYTNNGHVYGSV